MPKAGCNMRVVGESSALASLLLLLQCSTSSLRSQGSFGKQNPDQGVLSVYSVLLGRRWTGTLPAKSISFLTLQGNSAVTQGLPVLPTTGMSRLEQRVLLGFGSGLSLWFISGHTGVLICFPRCTCCTHFALGDSPAAPPKPRPCWGGLTWAGGEAAGGRGCPGFPSQLMAVASR